jgi:hypothetical protein
MLLRFWHAAWRTGFSCLLGRIGVWRNRLEDHRAVPRRPDFLRRQHRIHRLSLEELGSPAEKRAPDQLGLLCGIREHQWGDKMLKEVEGHDVQTDYAMRNAVARRERTREMEFKLILSSNYEGWNFTENTIATKNLSNEPWEFGYAMEASRPLAMEGAAHRCNFCRQHFVAEVELYGGLDDRYSFGLRDTSHYLGAGLAWNLPSGWTFRIEPTFRLNDNSHQLLLRWGVSREFSGFGSMGSGLFRGRQE